LASDHLPQSLDPISYPSWSPSLLPQPHPHSTTPLNLSIEYGRASPPEARRGIGCTSCTRIRSGERSGSTVNYLLRQRSISNSFLALFATNNHLRSYVSRPNCAIRSTNTHWPFLKSSSAALRSTSTAETYPQRPRLGNVIGSRTVTCTTTVVYPSSQHAARSTQRPSSCPSLLTPSAATEQICETLCITHSPPGSSTVSQASAYTSTY